MRSCSANFATPATPVSSSAATPSFRSRRSSMSSAPTPKALSSPAVPSPSQRTSTDFGSRPVRLPYPFISLTGNTADAAFLLTAAIAEVAEPLPDGSLRIDPVRLRDAVAATDMIGWATGQRIAFDRNGDRIGQGEEAGLVACEVEGGAFVEVTS